MKKAISYLRFSTPEQKFGSSTERQLKAAKDYCARNGLDLDETLSIADEGLSGYKGHHVEKGSLGHFLNEVKAGKIPEGTALIIQNLDRLSRQGIDATTDLLKALTKHGIDVHVIALNRVLRAGFNNSLVDYMLIGVQADLAHQESHKKSERIRGAYASKVNAIKNGKDATFSARVPAWVEKIDGKFVEVTETRGSGRTIKVAADTVRETFRLASLGVGTFTILKQIGITGVTRSWICKTLRNRAVLGEFNPNGNGEAIQGYFPQIVSQSDFDAARKVLESKKKGTRYRGGSVQKSDVACNLLTGLVYDLGYMAEPTSPVPATRVMHWESVTARGVRHQYLKSAQDVNQPTNRCRYEVIEHAVLRHLNAEDWRSVASETEAPEVTTAKAELETVLRELDKATRDAEKASAAIDGEEDIAVIKILARKLAGYEQAVTTLTARRDVLQSNVDEAIASCKPLHEPEQLLELIRQPEGADIRLRLRAEIRKRVKQIGLSFDPAGRINYLLEYTNGAFRVGATNKNGSWYEDAVEAAKKAMTRVA